MKIVQQQARVAANLKLLKAFLAKSRFFNLSIHEIQRLRMFEEVLTQKNKVLVDKLAAIHKVA